MVEKIQQASRIKDQNIDEKRNQWFEEFIHHVKTDQTFLNMGIASEETASLYDKVIFGNPVAVVSEMRDNSTRFFIGKLIMDYMKELNALSVSPLKLYLDHNDSEVLVWAEIKEDDEAVEMALYKAEAKANAKNYQHGFHISTTILEDVDRIPVPPHYQNLLKG